MQSSGKTRREDAGVWLFTSSCWQAPVPRITRQRRCASWSLPRSSPNCSLGVWVLAFARTTRRRRSLSLSRPADAASMPPRYGGMPLLSRFTPYPDRHGDQRAQHQRDAGGGERDGEAAGMGLHHAEEIGPDGAAEIAGTVDQPDADADHARRQHLAGQGPERAEASQEQADRE